MYDLRVNNPREVICTLVTDGEGSFRAVDENGRVLGIFTKSHVTLKAQALQRSHDFLLQDQSAKLLPKERVTGCLKRRIDKNKGRFVKYNEERCKAHWANVQRCGSICALVTRLTLNSTKLALKKM